MKEEDACQREAQPGSEGGPLLERTVHGSLVMPVDERWAGGQVGKWAGGQGGRRSGRHAGPPSCVWRRGRGARRCERWA